MLDKKADLCDSGFRSGRFRFRPRTILCEALHSSPMRKASLSGRRSLAIRTLTSTCSNPANIDSIVHLNTEASWKNREVDQILVLGKSSIQEQVHLKCIKNAFAYYVFFVCMFNTYTSGCGYTQGCFRHNTLSTHMEPKLQVF